MNPSEWILTDDVFMKPSYRISPFCTASFAANARLEDVDTATAYFEQRFVGYQQHWLLKARHGITAALEDLALGPNDTVTLLTTSGNSYISGCVTQAIELVCQWNQTLTPTSKAIVVIHEFGSLHRDMSAIYASGIPVIEDYAHAFHSFLPGGTQGDYLVFSFPKYFAIQYGGMLLSKKKMSSPPTLAPGRQRWIAAVLSAQLPFIAEWSITRRQHHDWLEKTFAAWHCAPVFCWQDWETPSVFLFSVPERYSLPALKRFMQQHGVECSVFYGRQAFFIPLHHRLSTTDLAYFAFLYQTFVEQEDAHAL